MIHVSETFIKKILITFTFQENIWLGNIDIQLTLVSLLRYTADVTRNLPAGLRETFVWNQ